MTCFLPGDFFALWFQHLDAGKFLAQGAGDKRRQPLQIGCEHLPGCY